MEFFDSHAHYNDEKFEQDRKEIINSIYEEGIKRVICVGYNLEQSKKALDFSKEFHFMYATCGISPNDIEDFVENNLREIEEIGKDSKIVAIGIKISKKNYL